MRKFYKQPKGKEVLPSKKAMRNTDDFITITMDTSWQWNSVFKVIEQKSMDKIHLDFH
jgi:hypothetical protein